MVGLVSFPPTPPRRSTHTCPRISFPPTAHRCPASASSASSSSKARPPSGPSSPRSSAATPPSSRTARRPPRTTPCRCSTPRRPPRTSSSCRGCSTAARPTTGPSSPSCAGAARTRAWSMTCPKERPGIVRTAREQGIAVLHATRDSFHSLRRALHHAAQAKPYLSPRLQEIAGQAEQLNPRHQEILGYMSEGASRPEIARMLGISGGHRPLAQQGDLRQARRQRARPCGRRGLPPRPDRLGPAPRRRAAPSSPPGTTARGGHQHSDRLRRPSIRPRPPSIAPEVGVFARAATTWATMCPAWTATRSIGR